MEVDGTFVRREAGLHGGKSSTHALTHVPMIQPAPRHYWMVRVPSALTCARVRWSTRHG